MSKGMKIAIGIVLIIAILACAYFLYQSILGDSNKASEPSQTPLPIPTLAPAPVATPTADGMATTSPSSTPGTGTVIDGQ